MWADLEPLSGPRVFGCARWRKDRVNISSELAQGRPAWGAPIARSTDLFTVLLMTIMGQSPSNQNQLNTTYAPIKYPACNFVRKEFSISEKREFADYQAVTPLSNT